MVGLLGGRPDVRLAFVVDPDRDAVLGRPGDLVDVDVVVAQQGVARGGTEVAVSLDAKLSLQLMHAQCGRRPVCQVGDDVEAVAQHLEDLVELVHGRAAGTVVEERGKERMFLRGVGHEVLHLG